MARSSAECVVREGWSQALSRDQARELCQLSVDGQACCDLPWNEAGPRIISSGLAFPNEGPAQRREEAALGVDSRRNQTRGL